jgi:hypothetical protein
MPYDTGQAVVLPYQMGNVDALVVSHLFPLVIVVELLGLRASVDVVADLHQRCELSRSAIVLVLVAGRTTRLVATDARLVATVNN